MPYVTDDDSKAVQRITEIEQRAARGKSGVGSMAGGGMHADQRRGTGPAGTGGKGPDGSAPGAGHRVGTATGLGQPGVARAGADAGQSLAQEDEGLRLSAGDGAVSGRAGGGTDGPLLVPQPSPGRQGERQLLRPDAVGRVRPHDARLGQRSGAACRGAEFVRGRPGAVAADGSQHVDPADCQRGVPFRPAGTEPPGTWTAWASRARWPGSGW